MAENPYLQPFFDSLSQGVQVAQHITSAAQQQQQLDTENALSQSRQALAEQEQREREQSTLADALRNGATPVDGSGNISVPNPSITSTMAPVTTDPNMNFTSPLVHSLMNANGGGSASVASDPGQTVTLGGRQVQMPSMQDQLERTRALDEAKDMAGRSPLTQEGSDMIGNMFAPGTLVDPAHMPGLAGIARAKVAGDKPEKTTKFEKAGFTDKGEPVSFDPDQNKYVVGKPIAGMAAVSAPGGANGEKQMTPNERQNAGDKAMASFHNFESQEMDLRQQLDRLDHGLKTGGAYTVTTDDKGKSKLVKAVTDKDGNPPDPQEILSDLQTQRENVGNRLRQVLTNKYDAGDQYAQIMTGKPTIWGMSRDKALSDLDSKLKGGTSAATPAAPAPAPAAPKKKVATMADIDAYAAKFKVTRAQAIAAAKAKQYIIQGE